MQETKDELKKAFKMKDPGELKYFLGIEFFKSKHKFLMHQRKYSLELILQVGLRGSKLAITPLATNLKLTSKQYDDFNQLDNSKGSPKDPLVDQIAYQKIHWKTFIPNYARPDISFGVQTVHQFLKQSKSSHMEVALKIIRYMKSQPGKDLLLSNNMKTTIIIFYDSDRTSCPQTRKLVSWKSMKQSIMSRNLAEAKFQSLVSVVVKLIWFLGL